MKRAAIREALGLKPDAQASDVVKKVIAESGHTCRVIDLLQLVTIMGGNLQLHVTDHDELDDEPETIPVR